MAERLPELGALVGAKLAELDAAIGARDLEGAALRFGELRALVDSELADSAALASLSNFLQTHSEREKASLARELHDSLGGILTPAKMDVAWLESQLGDDPQYGARVRRLAALIDQGIDLKRRIIENLRPSLLDHLGLASAVQWYMDEACRAAQIDCRVHISERLERLPPDLEIALYRLVQESLSNIVKHARATCVELSIDRTKDGLSLVISDDGVGIADLDYARTLSHGLAGMMHRIRSVNGHFDMQTQPGKGTRIVVFVPLK